MFTCFGYLDGVPRRRRVGCWRMASTPRTSPMSPFTRIIKGVGSDTRSSVSSSSCRGERQKIILYANPGAEPSDATFGFLPMRTAMAIWHDPAMAIRSGVLSDSPPAPGAPSTAGSR